MTDDKLRPLRNQIDEIDTQILALLSQRAKVAEQVGEVKRQSNAEVWRPDREAQVIRGLQARNPGPLAAAGIGAIFREIMSACRALETIQQIAFLGPEGTYSEQAVYARFGDSVVAMPCATIEEVFRACESGLADFGVVPVENSTEGAVSRTLDLFLTSSLSISAEVSLPIHHNLLSLGGSLEGVSKVAAHPQALAQCHAWLSLHAPHLERVSMSSNGEAARKAAEDRTLAALAGDLAAKRYGLVPIARHVQDDPHNRTRFSVIGRYQPSSTGSDQTSLILSVPDRAGAMLAMLEPLAKYQVSMKRIESRPARQGTWEYYFYVDLIGHAQDENVQYALAEIQARCAFFKVLGSYPRA